MGVYVYDTIDFPKAILDVIKDLTHCWEISVSSVSVSLSLSLAYVYTNE